MTCSDAPLFRSGFAAMALTGLLASTPCLAAGETAGPIEIGPSTATADPARSTATLHTVFGNQGDLPDRLIRAECPASGQIALRNGTLHDDVMAPNMSHARAGAAENGRQNGLDVPASVDGKAPMIQADLVLSQAKQPLTQGAHIPCALYFAHDGERIVVFTVGETPTPTAEP